MDNDTSVFRLGELYCGPGGLACGAHDAHSSDGRLSIVHAWANDYDEDTCETYRHNICPDHPESIICGDVRELNIPSLAPIDAFAYGFPATHSPTSESIKASIMRSSASSTGTELSYFGRSIHSGFLLRT